MKNVLTNRIFRNLGGERFASSIGAHNLVADDDLLTFQIPRNATSANRVKVYFDRPRDRYHVEFLRDDRRNGRTSFVAEARGLNAASLLRYIGDTSGLTSTLSRAA